MFKINDFCVDVTDDMCEMYISMIEEAKNNPGNCVIFCKNKFLLKLLSKSRILE